MLDGLAISLAGVAYAAALDGRPAAQARLGTALAVLASASSNGAWAWTRTEGDPSAVALAAGVPLAANIAFEVLLSEIRRQVHRRRGLPAQVAVTGPRLVRVALAPRAAIGEWRENVLALTAPNVPSPTARTGNTSLSPSGKTTDVVLMAAKELARKGLPVNPSAVVDVAKAHGHRLTVAQAKASLGGARS